MLLFFRDTAQGGEGRIIALFGAGMIGSAIGQRLEAAHGFRREFWPLAWQDLVAQAAQIEAIRQRIMTVDHSWSSSVIWSAGKAGFAAEGADVSRELESFAKVLGMAENLAQKCRMSFYLLSSAGGLFEGQRSVTTQSSPEPRRPYGRLKWDQERLLLASRAPLAKRILRLASVYGYVRQGQRRGLITTLLLNCLSQRVSHVFGKSTTLRHFLWIDDLAGHVANRLDSDETHGNEVSILAGDKPTSILEIQRLVEKTAGRKLYVSYSLDPTNSEDITFAPDTLADSWRSSDLAVTIRRIHGDALEHGFAMD